VKKGTAQKKARAGALSLGRITPRLGGPDAAFPIIPSRLTPRVSVSLFPPSRSPTRRRLVGHRRRSRTTPSAEAFIALFAGDEQPPGIPTGSLPFLLCEAERPNPNLTLLGYLMSPNFEAFCKNYRVYMCTSMSVCWVRPCPLESIFFIYEYDLNRLTIGSPKSCVAISIL
jgi:hypothetical protein